MIGRAFRNDRPRAALALAIALGLVALQYQGALLDRPWADQQGGTHLAVVIGAVVVLWWLADRDFDTLGLRVRAEPSWRFWAVATALVGVAVGAVCAGYLLVTGRFEALRFGAPDA